MYYHCLGTDKYRHGGEAICANPSLHGESFEQSVWQDVCSVLKDPGRLRHELERRLEASPATEHDAAQEQRLIAQLKRRIARLIDAYENGWLDKAEFESRIARAKERLAREEELWTNRERDASQEAELRLLIGHFETFAAQIADGLAHADFTARRKILRLLIQRIEVDEDELRIVYKVQPHPFAPSLASTASGGILQDCLRCCATPSAYNRSP